MADALYRVLMWILLPGALRRAAGDELAEVFRDQRAAARQAGLGGRAALWPRAVADLVWTGVQERALRRGRTGTRTGGVDVDDGMRGGGGVFGSGGLGQALRTVRRRPSRSALTVVTIGLGVGAATVVAVLGRDVLLRPLPYDDPGALVRLRELDEERGMWWPSRRNFEDWRAAGAAGVTMMEGASVPETMPVLLQGRAVRGRVVQASSGLFDLLGADFARGRGPATEEWSAGGVPVAVVGHAFWTTELAGAPLDGTELVVGTERFPVVGVLAQGFGFLGDGGVWESPDVWIPMERVPDAGERQNHGIHVVARMSAGVEQDRADEGLDLMAARVAEAHGEPTHALSVETTSLTADLLGPARRSLTFLLAGAAGVLLVACLNLGGTLLVDGMGRRSELAVRRALGAGRRQLVGQLLGEAALAALPGSVLGFGLAWAGIEAVRLLDPGALPRLEAVRVDVGVFALAAIVALAFALGAALLPGIVLSGGRATREVAAVGRSGPGMGLRRLWNGMIVAQVALTFTLLVGTGALLGSLVGMLRTDLGFETAGVTVVQVSLPESRYADPPRRAAYLDQGLEALRGLPGVGAASLTNVLPHVTQARIGRAVDPAGDPETTAWAAYRVVDPSYFDVLGIPVLSGGLEQARTAGTVVVDRTLVDRLLSPSPVGRQVRSGFTNGPVTVAGVVGGVREWSVPMGTIGTIYVDYRLADADLLDTYLLARGREGRLPDPAEVRRVLQPLDPEVPLLIEPLEAVMTRTLGSRRLVLAVTAAFGLLALLFASVGIYGIVAYIGRRKARESAVRLALGARPAHVRQRALAEGLVPTGTGILLGIALALAGTRVIQDRLDGVATLGVGSFAAAALLMVGVAALAGYLPARRVGRVDLTTVLREE